MGRLSWWSGSFLISPSLSSFLGSINLLYQWHTQLGGGRIFITTPHYREFKSTLWTICCKMAISCNPNLMAIICPICYSRVVHLEPRGAHPSLYTTCHQQTGSCQHSQNDHTFQYSAGSQCDWVSVPPLFHDGSITALLRRHHRPP